MTKQELLSKIGEGGVNHKLAARRIAGSQELAHLGADAEITAGMIENWINESPLLSGEIYVPRAGTTGPLSESDFKLIDRTLRPVQEKSAPYLELSAQSRKQLQELCDRLKESEQAVLAQAIE